MTLRFIKKSYKTWQCYQCQEEINGSYYKRSFDSLPTGQASYCEHCAWKILKNLEHRLIVDKSIDKNIMML